MVGADAEDNAAGRVTIIHGAASGWRRTGNRILSQATPGVPGRAEPDDRFGVAVTLLDHDRDGRLDLTAGASGENVDAGAITILRGGGRDVTTTGARTVGIRTLRWPSPAYAGLRVDVGPLTRALAAGDCGSGGLEVVYRWRLVRLGGGLIGSLRNGGVKRSE